jgi:protein TonB
LTHKTITELTVLSPMRTLCCYLLSACFHGGLMWLAASAQGTWHVDYAVRAGRAGAPGAPGGPQIEYVPDSQIELPQTVEIVAPAATANVASPAELASAAADDRLIAHSGVGAFQRQPLGSSRAAEPLAPSNSAQPSAGADPVAAAELPALASNLITAETVDATPQIVPGAITNARGTAPTSHVVEAVPAERAGSGGQGATGAQVDRLPGPLPSNPEPLYPEELRRQQIGGTVLLRVVISSDGSVERVTLEKTSGHQQLDDSALAAVRVWRFQPPRRNGVPTRFEALLPITFAIRGMTAQR